MPPRRLFGYSDRLTVRPGETLHFKVSSLDGRPYQPSLVRIINGDAVSGAGHYREESLEAQFDVRQGGRFQPVYPGSYVQVDDPSALDAVDDFTVQCYAYPTTPHGREQHLVGRWDEETRTGWSLGIDREGRVRFMLSRARDDVVECSVGEPLSAHRWHLVCGAVAARSGRVIARKWPLPWAVTPIPPASPVESTAEFPPATVPQRGDLRFAAGCDGPGQGRRSKPAGLFNGRLDGVRISAGVLSPEEILQAASPEPALGDRVVGCWDFARDIASTRITDLGAKQLHGHTVNLPVRALKGVRWTGDEYCWRHRPDHYGAIHFHEDDLYDCEWETDFTYTVPAGLSSGIYAVRLSQDDSEEHVTFFVAAPKGRPSARAAALMPTFSYLAYANEQMATRTRAARQALGFDGTGLEQVAYADDYHETLDAHPEFGQSLYHTHSDASGVHFSSWLRPIIAMAPKSNLWTLCADTLITAWLEHRGFDYDIITDDLLHEEGEQLLRQYRVVLTGNHPEYVSTPMLDAIREFLGEGGRLMYLGGNGFYWRVARSDALPGVIEVRRGRAGTRAWQAEVGEQYHQFTGELGGIWRDVGRPPQSSVGVGYIAEGFGGSTYYRRRADAHDPRAAFVFAGVEDEIIGDFGIMGGGAAGEEIDQAVAELGTPAHTLVLARSEGHNESMLLAQEHLRSSAPLEHTRHRVHADMVFFETEGGGAVFSTGSMTWIGSLSHNEYDNNVERITSNVLQRFTLEEAFVLP